jgi:hypothetical protein
LSAASEPVAELGGNGGRVRAGFRLLTPEPPAGGVVRLLLEVAALDGPVFVLAGTDRATGRPAHITIGGTLDGTALEDPLAGRPQLGGPSGAVEVAPDSAYRQVVLVNEFVRLEDTLDLVPPGEAQELTLECSRVLSPASSRKQALSGADAPDVQVRVAVPLRRDDAALEAEIASLAEIVRGGGASTSNELEDAVVALAALRLPSATAALAGFADHPNPYVREAAAAASAR